MIDFKGDMREVQDRGDERYIFCSVTLIPHLIPLIDKQTRIALEIGLWSIAEFSLQFRGGETGIVQSLVKHLF